VNLPPHEVRCGDLRPVTPAAARARDGGLGARRRPRALDGTRCRTGVRRRTSGSRGGGPLGHDRTSRVRDPCSSGDPAASAGEDDRRHRGSPVDGGCGRDPRSSGTGALPIREVIPSARRPRTCRSTRPDPPATVLASRPPRPSRWAQISSPDQDARGESRCGPRSRPCAEAPAGLAIRIPHPIGISVESRKRRILPPRQAKRASHREGLDRFFSSSGAGGRPIEPTGA